MIYQTYILKSLKDGGNYFGSTSDIMKRIEAHNRGSVKSTKGRRPLIIQYTENFPTRNDAAMRERFFKSTAGYRWLKEQNII